MTHSITAEWQAAEYEAVNGYAPDYDEPSTDPDACPWCGAASDEPCWAGLRCSFDSEGEDQ